MKKLQAREIKGKKKSVIIADTPPTFLPASPIQKTIGVINAFNFPNDVKSRNRAMTLDTVTREVYMLVFLNGKYFWWF